MLQVADAAARDHGDIDRVGDDANLHSNRIVLFRNGASAVAAYFAPSVTRRSRQSNKWQDRMFAGPSPKAKCLTLLGETR